MFPERLRELRKIKGITQIALSDELKVSKGTVAIVRVIQTITLKENAVKMEEDKNFEQNVQERERQEALARARAYSIYIYYYITLVTY